MAFVLSRSSSSTNLHSLHIVSDEGDMGSLSHPPSPPVVVVQEHSEMHTKPRIEILLDSPYLFLKGVGFNVEAARLAGHVAIYLNEPTQIKEITLQFRGKARLPAPTLDSMTMNSAPLVYSLCQHDWSFLEGEKRTSHTLKAGRHLFPFQLLVGGSLPSTMVSLALGGSAIGYKLRAQVVRHGFAFNQSYQCSVPVQIMRSFIPEAIEYQQTLEIENTWPEKVMYSIMVPHKAWAAGDEVSALVKFSPLSKGVCVLNVTTTIQEQTKVYGKGGGEHTRVVGSVKHEIVNGRAVEVENRRTMTSHPGTPARRNSWSSLSSALHHDDGNEEESSDVVACLRIAVPLTITPTHSLEPVVVSHRIRWNVLILNGDGHTSELRCSLPLHLLDYQLLDESRRFSAATRRLVLGNNEEGGGAGGAGGPVEPTLPSYNQHIRDRVANMFLPDSAAMRVANPWLATHTSPTRSSLPSSVLPQHPDPTAVNDLAYVNSELLLSLSTSDNNLPIHSPAPTPSLPLSRLSTRPNTPPEQQQQRHTYVHSGHASWNLHTLHTPTMKPVAAGWISRSSAPPLHHHPTTPAAVQAAQRSSLHHHHPNPPTPTHTASLCPEPEATQELLHRAFTEVPDYAVASRGFIGGVTPLSTMQGLPSYDESVVNH